MGKKIVLTAIYGVILWIVIVYNEVLLAFLDGALSIPLVMALTTFIALFPVIPYPLIGGLVGAAYGGVWGGFITWFGSTMASMIFFLFVRYAYRDFGSGLLHKYKRLDRLAQFGDRHVFWFVVFTRMIPFIPSMVVNGYVALRPVQMGTFFLASALGKIPSAVLFAMVGNALVNDWKSLFYVVGVYAVFLLVTYALYTLYQTKRRAKKA